MKYIIQLAALALIGALGFYAARTLSPDAISLLFGMSIMLLTCVSIAVIILASERDRKEVAQDLQQRRQQQRPQLENPTYYITQDAPAQRRQLAQAKRIEVIK